MDSREIECLVEKCDKQGRRRGLCDTHYERQRIDSKTEKCASPVCEKIAITRGFCYGHYSRLRAGKPTDTPLNRRRSNGDGVSRNEEGLRQCSGCREFLGDESFTKGTASDGLSVLCERCRARYRLLKYGIAPADYERMMAEQGGLCKICGNPPGARSLHVDHDHSCCPRGGSCGKCVRGLLCGNCNSALGLFKENQKNLLSAIEYLADYRKG